MQLVEQSKLDLHADVNDYLDFELRRTFAQPITLHHLLTHTAGFEDEAHSLFVASESELLSLREHLIRYQPARVYLPGNVMAYSNYGTALAGYIVERVSGQSFESYLTDHILRPLGMAHSFVGNRLPPELAANISQGYQLLESPDYIGSPFPGRLSCLPPCSMPGSVVPGRSAGVSTAP
ncbi:MAG: serine hydrolase domain-containing protein [Oscillochloridaceae bacterium umkhey_bin13]